VIRITDCSKNDWFWFLCWSPALCWKSKLRPETILSQNRFAAPEPVSKMCQNPCFVTTWEQENEFLLLLLWQTEFVIDTDLAGSSFSQFVYNTLLMTGFLTYIQILTNVKLLNYCKGLLHTVHPWNNIIYAWASTNYKCGYWYVTCLHYLPCQCATLTLIWRQEGRPSDSRKGTIRTLDYSYTIIQGTNSSWTIESPASASSFFL